MSSAHCRRRKSPEGIDTRVLLPAFPDIRRGVVMPGGDPP
jgi:hypothetical protein